MPDSSNLTFPATDAVDPASVPQRQLRSGAKMPAIGLGTFGSDHVPHAAVADAVKLAAPSAIATSTALPSTATKT